MASISIIREKCVGCKLCVQSCLFNAIIVVDGKAEITEKCILCGSCVEACKFQAIVLEKAEENAEGADCESGIWVFTEQFNNRIKPVAYELLGEASRLASVLDAKVSAIFMGCGIEEGAERLIECGADEVLVIDHPDLFFPNEQIYPELITQLVRKYKPQIFLFGATTFGRSIAPRIASKLGTGLTADCTRLSIDLETGLLLQTRPAFSGNLMATIVCRTRRPQMATVRPNVMKALAEDKNRKGVVIHPDVIFPDDLSNRVMQVLVAGGGQSNLEEADVIVAAGRGIGGVQNMALVKKLADVLGAGIGASRAIVDLGWIEYSRQIGQTGRTVAPKVYIACGISGAIQHLAGISSSCYVIAINKDADAPIFKIADLGIVGDCTEIIPVLIREFENERIPV